MKFVNFEVGVGGDSRFGVLSGNGSHDYVVDLARAKSEAETSLTVPSDAESLLRMGDAGLTAVREILDKVALSSANESDIRDLTKRQVIFRQDAIMFLPPVPRPGKIIMVGTNYRSHASEGKNQAGNLPAARSEKHEWPVSFSKFPSVMVGHGQPIVYPAYTKQLDYEAELCVIIGKKCKNVTEADALNLVAGYTIANDVSMRDLQFAEMRRGAIMMGKNLDTSSPMGPYFVTKDEIPEPHKLEIRCWVNGEIRQHDNTNNMIYSIPWLIAYFSRMTLEPGDIISTGTMAGVGIFHEPPEAWLLKIGDVVDIEIERLGRLSNTITS
jgi:2-keto-4-pentenoate hydratase/2-oxohepta-3-ene-1,7-dioic acid hydratase in catechol pathway